MSTATLPAGLDLSKLTPEEQYELLELLEDVDRRLARRKIDTYYPETGPLRRELYKKHLEFFEAGATHNDRCALAANRVGKTEGIGAYELTLHLTGQYPAWWNGRRFDRQIRAWACGKTAETVREILQVKLLGPADAQGTGMIPGDAIVKTTRAAGLAESADTVYVKNVAGGSSQLMFKSYDQKRRAFEGTEVDVIWPDEEPPLDILTECQIRTMTCGGSLMCTFTPLDGITATIKTILGGTDLQNASGQHGSWYVVTATWDDAPHLTKQQRDEYFAKIPPHQRDARTRGIPQLGSGAIYPVPESDFVVPDFQLPEHVLRAYGMDVGWNRTAAVWGAKDRTTGITYIYGEYYRAQAEPVVHAAAIKARGEWIRGAVDPAARGRGQQDGQQLLKQYQDQGLKLEVADNSVETGLLDVWQMLSTGRLKVFKSCVNWLSEFRLYRRNEKGAVVKENDHLMDATRYLIRTGMDLAANRASLLTQQQRPNSSLVMPRRAS